MVHPDIFDKNGNCKGRLRNIGNPSGYYIKFGKYRNKTYAFLANYDIPYIRWLLTQEEIKKENPFLWSYFNEFIYHFDM